MTDPTHRLRRYGEDLASAVSPARSRVAAMRAIGRAQRTAPGRLPRIAFATLGALVVTNVAAAAVADAAVPGDALYPLDRAYEKVMDLSGLGGDHSPERIAEAQVLMDREDPAGAMDLVAEAVDTDSVRHAVAAARDVDPSDPVLSEFVRSLVGNAHELVVARRNGEGDRVAEARAAVDLLATQIADAAHPADSDRAGPPAHAGEQGPPPHSRHPEEFGPSVTPPGRDGPTDDPGPPGDPAPPGTPGGGDPPEGPEPRGDGSPGSPPSDSPGEPQGPPETPSGGPSDSGQDASPGASDDPPGRGGGRP